LAVERGRHMITRVKNTAFTNNKSVGDFVNVGFSTQINVAKGQREKIRVRARTHYLEVGEGPPVLFLHGTAQSAYIFKHNYSAVAQKHRVIMPDLLGHGYSGCPDMDYTIEDNSLFLESFANALQLEKFSIVAYGQSAAYALDFCYYNKERVNKMVVMNPGSFRNTAFTGARLLGSMLGGVVAKRYANRNFMKKAISKGFFDQTVLSEKDLTELSRPFENPDVRFCNRLSVSNFDDHELVERLYQIETPVLFIEGEDDVLSSEEGTAAYFDALPEVYVMKIRNCGTLSMFEKPEYVNRGILEFLAYRGTQR
jgi:pimeloyl-ACP methyl ester carboxylesterase